MRRNKRGARAERGAGRGIGAVGGGEGIGGGTRGESERGECGGKWMPRKVRKKRISRRRTQRKRRKPENLEEERGGIWRKWKVRGMAEGG